MPKPVEFPSDVHAKYAMQQLGNLHIQLCDLFVEYRLAHEAKQRAKMAAIIMRVRDLECRERYYNSLHDELTSA